MSVGRRGIQRAGQKLVPATAGADVVAPWSWIGTAPGSPASERENEKAPQTRGILSCAEEDSNLHPVIPDQAVERSGRCAMRPYGSTASFRSSEMESSDESDGVHVVSGVVNDDVRRRRLLLVAVAVA